MHPSIPCDQIGVCVRDKDREILKFIRESQARGEKVMLVGHGPSPEVETFKDAVAKRVWKQFRKEHR